MVSTAPLYRPRLLAAWHTGLIVLLVALVVPARAWLRTPDGVPEQVVAPFPDVAFTQAAVAAAMVLLPIICAAFAWLMTQGWRAAILAAVLAVIFERYSSLVQYPVASLIIIPTAFLLALLLFAISGLRSAGILAIPAGVLAAWTAAWSGAEASAGFVLGMAAISLMAVLARAGPSVYWRIAGFSAGAIAGIALLPDPYGTVLAAFHVTGGQALTGGHFRLAAVPASVEPALLQAAYGKAAGFWLTVFDAVQKAGGILVIAYLIYLRPSWRLARAKGFIVPWLAAQFPLFLLLGECLWGNGHWSRTVVATVPFVVVPSIIWRTW